MDPLVGFFSSLDPTVLPLGGIVTFMVIGLIRGWVVPKQVLTDRVNDKDGQITALAKERDDWRNAFLKSDEARQELVGQNSELIDGAKTTNRLMESLRNQIERTVTPIQPIQPPHPTQQQPPPTQNEG